MGFKEAVVHVFRNYANFSGRARRSEYWYFTLFYSLILLVLFGLVLVFEDSPIGMILSVVYVLTGLALVVPIYALIWRRLHDTGRSGAMSAICAMADLTLLGMSARAAATGS